VNGSRTSQGPSTTPNQVQYTYTASGQLASYSDSSRGITSTYSYDASGQRTKSLVVQGTQTTTTTYVYEGLTLLELSATYTDSNNPGNNTSWRIDYLSDENDRPYGGTYRLPASSTSPTLFCLVTSDRGDIVELTDSAGNAFCGYHYDAWGNPQGGTGGIQSQATGLLTAALAGQIASRQVLRYAGYAYDTESGLYYCSARSYDPLTRQFVSIDSAKAEGEKSAYQYCGGNPVGNTDPSGRYLDPGCGDGSGGSSSHGWHNTWVRVWIPAYWTYHWDIVGYIRKYDWRKIVEIPDYRHLFKSADDFALKMFNDLAGNPATWDYLNIRCRPDAPVDSSDPTYVHNWSELKTHSDWFDWIKEWGRTNQCQYWRPLNGDRSYLVFDAYWKWNSGHVVEHVFLGVEKYIVSKTPIWRYVKWVYYAGKYAWKLERKWV
jgi:RHS repeat-associated protein